MLEHDALLENLKEHPGGTSAPPLARGVAAAIDLGILSALCFLSAAVLAGAFGYHPTVDSTTGTETTYLLFSPAAIAAIVLAYFPGCWARWGRTPAMRLLGLRIVDEDTLERIDRRTALFRFGALLLAIAPAFLGLLAAFVNDRGQAWHDGLSHTVVVAE